MAKKMTLDHFNSQITDCKREDREKKINMALNVFKYCQKNAKTKLTYIPRDSYLEMCLVLTGVPMETLSTVNTLEHKTKPFKEWLIQEMIKSDSNDYDRLKKHLIQSYTKEHEIPTLQKNNAVFNGYNHNFTLLQLPGTKSSIIVEKPESVMERHKFLDAKMKYREAKKNLVYIGMINILLRNGHFSYEKENIEPISHFTIAASPLFGRIGYIYCRVHTPKYMTNWIEDTIIPKLPKECVIIFQENVLMNTDKTIDSYSTKKEMLDWLQSHKVHHEPTMHRADLYKLINTFKSGVEQLSPADETFKAHGHIVLRKKKCNLKVNYFDPFWDFLIQELNAASTPGSSLRNYTTVSTINETLHKMNVSLHYWQYLENVILNKEREIYKEDLAMEDVIDKLVTMVECEGLPKEEKVNEYRKTIEEPPMYLHDSFRNLYMHGTQDSLVKFKSDNKCSTQDSPSKV